MHGAVKHFEKGWKPVEDLNEKGPFVNLVGHQRLCLAQREDGKWVAGFYGRPPGNHKAIVQKVESLGTNVLAIQGLETGGLIWIEAQ